MDIVKTEDQGVIILSPDGRLDSNSAPLLEQERGLIGAGDSGHHLLLDFSKVEYISSAGLRVVLKTVREVFEISGFDSYVTIHPDTLKAIESFKV